MQGNLDILLIEDNPADATLMREVLARSGHVRITWASCLSEGLQTATDRRFDAVLLDLSLPDSAGLDTIALACAALPTTPLIVLTGLADEEIALEAVRQGAQDYLVKGQADRRAILRAVHYAIDRKAGEEVLRRSRDELDRMVRERTTDLARTVDVLQAEVRQRQLAERELQQANEVLQERSDQLRVLASELTLAEQRERRRLAEVLHDHLQQLLVGALFQLARLERAKDHAVRQAAMGVHDLIDQSIECSRSLTGELSPPILHEGGLVAALEWLVLWMEQKHGMAVLLRADEQAEPDTEDMKVLLFQAIRELLFNAVKHAQVKTARVQVRRAGGLVEVLVADEGVGFDPLAVRAKAGTTGGFGLFSIRERLALLGGQMEVDSAPGHGSRFTLRAPLRRPGPDERTGEAHGEPRAGIAKLTAPAGPAPAAATDGPRRIRVLLADDHLVVRQGLARLLREEPDIEIVAEASDGLAAVELARQLLPDVVTMDISMPRLDGIEATKILRAELPEIRVIGLSMFEEAERAAAMRQAGAVNYLAKNGPADALIEAIRACVRPAG